MKTIPSGEDNDSIMVSLRRTIQQKHRFTYLCSSCNMSGGNMLENINIFCRFISKESSINNLLAFRIFKTVIKSSLTFFERIDTKTNQILRVVIDVGTVHQTLSWRASLEI